MDAFPSRFNFDLQHTRSSELARKSHASAMATLSSFPVIGGTGSSGKPTRKVSTESGHLPPAFVRMPDDNDRFKRAVDSVVNMHPGHNGNRLFTHCPSCHKSEFPGEKPCLCRGNHSETKKSKVLVIGGTGYLGKFIVEASAKSGNPTFVIMRNAAPSDPEKAKIVEGFKILDVILLQGDINDRESLLNAIKQVDVVISVVGSDQVEHQGTIVDAIKATGNIKRFLPSEFGNDVDRVHAVEPAKGGFAKKAQIRRLVEAAGIPYTYVCANSFAGYYLPTLSQPWNGRDPPCSPPRDKVFIYGDGNAKVVINKEDDIGTYTIKAVDDPRTLKKILYIRPPDNTYSMNDLVSLWERKIGKTLNKEKISEKQILKNIQDDKPPGALMWALYHCNFVKGDHTNFEIDPSLGVEASELYPDVKCTTVDQYLNQFV